MGMKKRNLSEELMEGVNALRQEREGHRVIKRVVFDPENPPPLTPQQEAELEALKAMPDSEIDTSDIPVLSGVSSF